MHNINKVTVIIPLYNPDVNFLLESLQIIIDDEGKLIEKIILVDDGSDFPIKNYAVKFNKISHKIITIAQSNKGPGGARNAGVALADTEIIAFLDHDCRPTKNWLKKLISPILNGNLIGTGGTVLSYSENNTISKFADFRELLRRPVRNSDGKITNIITANSAFRKDVFIAVGGFDERLNRAAEDLDFTYKLVTCGYQNNLCYVPKSIVLHRHRSNLKEFWKQQSSYGFGSVCHCIFRNRDPREIGFVFPKPLNILKYIFNYLLFSFSLVPTIKNRYGKLNKYIYFPLLEFIRRFAILTGGIKSYYKYK